MQPLHTVEITEDERFGCQRLMSDASRRKRKTFRPAPCRKMLFHWSGNENGTLTIVLPPCS
ncbi:hypothetical protein BDM02DRAFT_3122374 [Thelephora ganbajun]|uniref:Uncharacterized protein n=1 Tax=Thelephora ganbajun TaxID=370292 RepID=A0ACB6Z2Z8_THEGA|nr:hypothetical protein BDM02DRAFT_3122374 [Thelephora ganbajun]